VEEEWSSYIASRVFLEVQPLSPLIASLQSFFLYLVNPINLRCIVMYSRRLNATQALEAVRRGKLWVWFNLWVKRN
jgi:hypothetical protein